jgi:Na+/H+ antiporter NhaD/arsenite permease-like protein
MIGSLVIFAIAYLLIATERMDKTAAALLGASACVLLHLVPYEHALAAVDLNVIFLLVGMMLGVNVMAATGLFEWLAVTIARIARGDGVRILTLFLLATAVLSAFLDNVTTVILVAPITVLICEILEIKAMPFLIMEALASNIGGAATLVGDPPNVIIASQTGLTFNQFIVNMGPPVLIMLFVGLPVAAVLFRKQMTVPEENKARIMKARPELAILDKGNLIRALAVFALILGGFFASHAIGIEPGIIALAGALLMAIVCGTDLHHALEKVEWNSVFFFVGLFMLIGSLEYNGVFEKLGHLITDWTQGNFLLTVMTILWFSAVVSAIVDNIPLVIAMIPLIQSIIPAFGAAMGVSDDPTALQHQVAEPLYWALALGACLGGNGSLVGASANVVVAQIGRRNGYPLSFLAFTRMGAPVMLVTLVISTGWLYVRYFA